MSQFLDYNEAYAILHDRIKAQQVEIEYWAKNSFHTPFSGQSISLSQVFPIPNRFVSFLIPFVSDLPNSDKSYLSTSPPFDHTLCFYLEKNVMSFFPPLHTRLVLIQDLPGRLWHREGRSEINPHSDFPALEKAAQNGILRFYNPETYNFTYYKNSKNGSSHDKLWYYTSEGEKYLSGKGGEFFLLQDIVNIERIFFNRPRNECLEELGFDPKDKDFE